MNILCKELTNALVSRKQLAQQLQGDNTHLLIFASPFSRTRETAECVAQATGIDDSRLQLAAELRERNFGCFELTSHDNYAAVWAEDSKSADFRPSGGSLSTVHATLEMPAADSKFRGAGEGESVKDVASRLVSLIQQIESKHTAQIVLLVAHGDTLSILWALVIGQPLESHRSIAIQTGELRQLYDSNK